jgi:hypothetical protein
MADTEIRTEWIFTSSNAVNRNRFRPRISILGTYKPSQIQHRASGAVKSMAYGNNTTLNLGYNARGLIANYSINGAIRLGSDPPQPVTISASYQYHADGQVKFVQDQAANNSIRDRAYKYDQAGRLGEALSATEARDYVNGSSAGATDGPYRQSYTYDAWNNMVTQSGRYWNRNVTSTINYNQLNRNPDWSYDAEGNLISRNPLPYAEEFPRYSYDAAGREAKVEHTQVCEIQPQNVLQLNVYTRGRKYDGDGQSVGYVQTRTVDGTMAAGWPVTVNHLRSTVLGGRVISNYNGQGAWIDTQVYAGTERIGSLGKTEDGATPYNTFRYADPLTGDEVTTAVAGGIRGQTTLDTNGVNVPLADPFPPAGEDGDGSCVIWDDSFEGNGKWAATVIPIEGSAKCVLDGLPMECRFISGESSVQCPNNDCGTHAMTVTGRTRDGRAVASSTLLVRPGELGWDGSLDGTYHVYPSFSAMFNFNTSAGAALFTRALAGDYSHLDPPFIRVSGGAANPQNPVPGFDKGKLKDVNKALADGAKLLQNSDCQKGLAQAGINVTGLIKAFGNLKARPDSDPSIRGYNIFYAENSTDPQVQQFLQTERGKGAGGFIYGQDVMLRKAFFNARGGANISGEISRALALIHEAVHLTGKSDEFFRGSSKLNDVVIHACWSKLYGHNDLAIVGN